MLSPNRFAGPLVAFSALLMCAACAGTDQADTAESNGGSGDSAVAVSVADIIRDLEPRLQAEFGDATLACGVTDIFSGGFVSAPLRGGNAMACTYFSDMQSVDGGQPVWVDVLVMMTSDDAYTYSANKKASFAERESGGAAQPVPEWLYRDGLTCDQLTSPVTAETLPGPDFAANSGLDETAALSYAEVYFYWLDSGQRSDLDPQGDGRPCSDNFPSAQVDEFLDSATTVEGTDADVVWTEPLTSTFDIRSALATDADMPTRATQVDCSLVGPVAKGSSFSCAPRLNAEPDTRSVVVVNAEGGFLAGPTASQLRREPATHPRFYRAGLTCRQLTEPVTADTFNTETGMTFEQAVAQYPTMQGQGLNYLNAVFYAFGTDDSSQVIFDDQGWPCTADYPADEVAAVIEAVRYPEK